MIKTPQHFSYMDRYKQTKEMQYEFKAALRKKVVKKQKEFVQEKTKAN